MKTLLGTMLVASLVVAGAPAVWADPCGMVPPIYTGPGSPITRIGLQQTYVFYKDGVETFVIRPGFSGRVDTFGMLIPFPTPPAIRKVPDDIFTQIANAIDPPEVVINIFPSEWDLLANSAAPASQGGLQFRTRRDEQVRVIKQEAVGMYEVAVLQAGSSRALQRWMSENNYQYPEGMDHVCDQYIQDQWCFVAVKTKVGQKQGVDPKPGQRDIQATLPEGSNFDGFVQAMGFRFETDQLVVPMRLSAFNAGELRNVVYILADGPRRIRAIPEEYVVRQVAGGQLIENLTRLLPLRIIGGTEKDIPQWQLATLPQQRDPKPHNGQAKQLFAADLLAVHSGQLSLPHEETEKELLRIGEHLALRGPEIDALNAQAIQAELDKTTNAALAQLAEMTLTVVDGDFPREILAGQNLTFAQYRMPARRNSPANYDTKLHAPAPRKLGFLKTGSWRPNSDAPLSRPGYSQLQLPRGVFALAVLAVLAVALLRRNAGAPPVSPSKDQGPKHENRRSNGRV